uniref:Receptor-like serine/threonine-protein kinase n=1 Tax=Kalanchoe fedtschenkoi TaxID=63787 RepID=A0A7N0UJ32_KALFE
MEFVCSMKRSFYFGLVLFSLCSGWCWAIDTIRPGQFFKDSDFLESNGSAFRLGFFSPEGSTNRYVGIWYNLPRTDVIWVANREKPLTDSSGVLRLSEQGNVILMNGQNEILWSSNVSSSSADSTVQLLDSGSLVLQGSDGSLLWQSIEHLGNTFFRKSSLSTNLKTGEKKYLTSWLTESDPSYGNFTATLVPLNMPEVFVWNNGVPYWRSGPWNGQYFMGVPFMTSTYLDGFSVAVQEGTTYLTFDYSYLISFRLNSSGVFVAAQWNWDEGQWLNLWISKTSDCDVYGKCGAFGSCNAERDPICSCLPGFVPKNADEWSMGNWKNGCIRRSPLLCERMNGSYVGKSGEEDGFLRLQMMKVPDFSQWKYISEEDCRPLCFGNCSCLAYAFHSGIGCMTWSRELVDIQKFSGDGTSLYLRVAHSELGKKQDHKATIVSVTVLGTVFIVGALYFTLRWKITRKRGRKRRSASEVLLSDICCPAAGFLDYDIYNKDIEHKKLEEVTMFSFEVLARATNNFDAANKLGQGGFGPVYMGVSPDGKKLAVKRLSRNSGQGLKEFMNEVEVISKLQHRNLVRLLGCCVERDEKMLVYEYMPNRSLDAYIFDPSCRGILQWRKRFEIIEGIGRGLLYLHRDSVLKIIHRDLKASNILLDEDLNPKISDFGMARIFKSNQNQADTLRVVGTYGYMSPEYAMEGRFSDKSDVFSFGVLLLEIVGGRRNTSFYEDDGSLSLIGYAWKLWSEGSIEQLVDPALSSSSTTPEDIIRCVHVGLLCVQDSAHERPGVSTILSMLSSEIVDLPPPKQPAFVELQVPTPDPNNSARILSKNSVTITDIGGR